MTKPGKYPPPSDPALEETALEETALEETAMHWIVHLESDGVTDDEKQAFQVWLAAAPEHRRAHQRVLEIWQGAGMIEEMRHIEPRHRPRTAPGAAWIIRIMRKLPAFPLPKAAVAGGLMVLLALCGVILYATLRAAPEAYQTQIAEIRTVQLPDGSQVTLGANSHIILDFTKQDRRVRLEKGEAFFAVTRDPARPFLVLAQDTLIRVTGTRFNVHNASEKVVVSVLEGKVEVAKTAPPPEAANRKPLRLSRHVPATEFQPLNAGQQLESEYNKPLRKITAQPRRKPDAWLTGHLVYNYATLSEVIADANRYSHTPIIIDAEEVGDLKVTAAFRTDQIDRMIEALSGALPIRVIHAPDGRVRITAK